MFSETYPIQPYPDRPANSSGCDSIVFFNPDTVMKIYPGYIHDNEIVWQYVRFMNTLALEGTLRTGTIVPPNQNLPWFYEIRSVPISDCLFTQTEDGLAPTITSTRVFGPNHFDFSDDEDFDAAMSELRQFGALDDEIQRFHTIRSFADHDWETDIWLYQPIERMNKQLRKRFGNSHVWVHPINYRVRSPRDKSIVFWITDLGVSIKDII